MTPKIERYVYRLFRLPNREVAELPVAIIKGYKGRRFYQLELPDNPSYDPRHSGWRLHKRLPDRKIKVWRKRRAKGGVL